MSKPYTDEEIRIKWDDFMSKHSGASEEFKLVHAWMFDFEEFKKVMKLAHLPNPFIRFIPKKE